MIYLNQMNKNLIIRADASTRIGTGHIMRCIALAQAWKDQGGDVTFLSHCDGANLRKRIEDEGFDFVPIEKPHPDPYDLQQILTTFKAQSSKFKTWVVVDGYHFTPDYQKTIRGNGYRLLVIDDTAHLDHYHADILLNQNIHASSLHYSCDRDTVKLLGCEYVLLRREFLKYKDWNRVISDKAKKILVTMGGSDSDNVTLKVFEALNNLDVLDLEVKVVVGPANPNINTLKKKFRLSPFTSHLLSSVSNMSELMAWADIAVSAGGSTCWELAFMGLPFVAVILAENQERIAIGLEKTGVGANAGWHNGLTNRNMVPLLRTTIFDREVCFDMSQNGRRLVDGRGAGRIIEIMEQICV